MSFVAAMKNLLGMEYQNAYYEEDYEEEENGNGNGNAAPTRKRQIKLLKFPSPREKSIYTLQPASYDDAAVAADYLKSGAAIFVNLQNVNSNMGRRMVDVLSGVCCGVDGHSHKVGERLFLFLPQDFYITSEEKSHLEDHGLFLNGFRESLRAAPQATQINDRQQTGSDSFERASLFSCNS
ncbi:MAG: hypothetical protein COZ05_05050 [Armatimonadetes bacterium CG_4_10_14_3_um_filter_59_10]|nr:MAG: hypothetical protein COZ05_05050 [Armatimonadetes bacterium CG_4_10_14_3_um_filter_59_10]